MEKIKLSQFSLSFKILFTCFLFVSWVGYGVALLKIQQHSNFSVHEAVLSFRGDDSDPMRIAQSYGGLLSVTHVHAFSQPFLFFIVGLIFCFSSLQEKTKAFCIVTAFTGMLASNASPWLIKYISPSFGPLLLISQIMISITLLVMTWVIFRDLWTK